MTKEIFERIKKATVAIVAIIPHTHGKRPFTIVGSGFCIDSEGIIITCEHVFRAFINPADYLSALGSMEKEKAPKLHELRGAQPHALFFNGIVGNEFYLYLFLLQLLPIK